MASKEYEKGYKEAIEAIKKSLSGDNQNASNSQNGKSSSGLTPPPTPNNNQDQQGQNSNGGKSERDSNSGGNQGVVRPEDCIGPDQLSNTPSTPGTMVDKETGEDIAKKEGYKPESGSEDQVSKQWQEAAKKMAETMKQKGKDAGSFISKIEGLYKVTKNWKKELEKIVGYSISPDNTRRAFASKKVLLTQDRLARTDKTLFDAVDYMVAFIDSSGSMSDEQLKMCLSTVYAVALAKKPIKLYVVQCDTKIQDIQEFNSVQDLKRYARRAKVLGRGGTDFKPCWELLKNDKRFKSRRTELAMLFTDGECDQYKRDVKTMANLCWVIIDNPSFELKYKDACTKVVRINSKDVK